MELWCFLCARTVYRELCCLLFSIAWVFTVYCNISTPDNNASLPGWLQRGSSRSVIIFARGQSPTIKPHRLGDPNQWFQRKTNKITLLYIFDVNKVWKIKSLKKYTTAGGIWCCAVSLLSCDRLKKNIWLISSSGLFYWLLNPLLWFGC